MRVQRGTTRLVNHKGIGCAKIRYGNAVGARRCIAPSAVVQSEHISAGSVGLVLGSIRSSVGQEITLTPLPGSASFGPTRKTIDPVNTISFRDR